MEPLIPQLAAWLRQSEESKTRFCFWLTGSRAWTQEKLGELSESGLLEPFFHSPILISDTPLAGIEPVLPHRARTLLGQETELLIYDAYGGLNPDAIGQASGLVKGGGFLLFISADPESDRFFDDSEKERLAVEPYTKDSVGNHFLNHLRSVFETSTGVLRLDEQKGYMAPVSLPLLENTISRAVTEQAQLVDSFIKVFLDSTEQKNNLKAVITAQRGRGKSAALGMIAGRLTGLGYKVLVTAPEKRSLVSLFRHYEMESAQSVQKVTKVTKVTTFRPDYRLPSDAVSLCNNYDLLIVDEAAGISVDVLNGYQNSSTRVIYATTTQGYEGTGQGFRLRFLNQLAEQPMPFRLQYPVRWSDQDPLEKLLNQALLLDCRASQESVFQGAVRLQDSATQSTDSAACEHSDVSVRKVSQSDLSNDLPLLKRVFDLLIDAHYRTTPGDLRILMDSPNLHIWVAEKGTHLVGVCMTALEGPLERALSDAVWRGERRPRGHLIPQLLIAQEGYLEAGTMSSLRIIRIAVSTDTRRNHIATNLLNAVEHWAQDKKIDLMGAAFSASSALLKFWSACGYTPVRLGTQVDPISASVATLVLKGLNSSVMSGLFNWSTEFQAKLDYLKKGWLIPGLGQVQAELLIENIEAQKYDSGRQKTDAQRWHELYGFAYHHRSFESIAFSFDCLVRKHSSLYHSAGLTPNEHQLIQQRVLKLQSPEVLCSQLNLHGPKALNQSLKQATRKLYSAYKKEM